MISLIRLQSRGDSDTIPHLLPNFYYTPKLIVSQGKKRSILAYLSHNKRLFQAFYQHYFHFLAYLSHVVFSCGPQFYFS